MEQNFFGQISRHQQQQQHSRARLESPTLWGNDGYALDLIYFYSAEAFDSVPHAWLISKLESYGIKSDILNSIDDFFTSRRQRVGCKWIILFMGSCAKWTSTQYVCYVNGIPDCVHNLVAMYADDTKIFSKIEAKGDDEKLQIDLSKLEEWSRSWQLRFNASKCTVMHYGRQNPCH